MSEQQTNDTPNRVANPGRRAFLADVGVKAAYITPIVLTLTAAPAVASPFAASCKPIGQPCTRNPSCCTRNCDVGGTNLCVP